MMKMIKGVQVDPGRSLLVLKIVLGVVFVIAGIGKLTANAEFVSEVTGYGLLSPGLARVYASVLPWVELVTGLSLVAGLFTVPALVLSVLMALSFLIANIFVLAHGNTALCNCFGQLIPLNHTASLIIDCAMVAAGGLLIRYRKNTPNIRLDDRLSRITWSTRPVINLLPRPVFHGLLLGMVVLVIGVPASFVDARTIAYKEMDDALAAGRPVVLSFYLEGCEECAEERTILGELAATYGSYIAFIRADFHTESRLARDFGVYRVPSTVFLGGTPAERHVIETIVGLVTKDMFLDVFYDKIRVPFWERFGPMARFTADPVAGDVPIKVKFRDISRGVVETWAWDFNSDGIIDSTVQNPSNIFSEPGNYDVTLSVNGTFGADVITRAALLDLSFARGEADFTASPKEFTDPTTAVQFRDTSKGYVEQWAWDFDDDGTIDSTERDPVYIYGSPGHYAVRLTIRGPFGVETVKKENYIYVINTIAEANFTASITEIEGKNQAVHFYDESQGDITAWEWDFDGDGTIDSSEENPVYTYARDGVYSVTLTIRTATGEDTLTLHDYITVRGCST